mgnify:CR=1 FL=1
MDLNNISPFIKTVYDVMPQLGFENITSTDIETVNKKITASGVMLTVGVVGELRGNIVYIMDKASSMKTASKMMMGMPVDTFDEMAKSAVSELSNMISGNASTAIAAKGFVIDIAPPTLITGENMRLATNVKKSLVVPVSTTAGNIDIWVSLE